MSHGGALEDDFGVFPPLAAATLASLEPAPPPLSSSSAAAAPPRRSPLPDEVTM